MEISDYFKRIKLSKYTDYEIDLKFLRILQNKHILSVPFENFDVMNNIKITLEYERLFDKIVNKKRGGFCFEQNGLFYYILKELEFNVWMSEAAVFNAELNKFGNMRDHMVLIVRLDKLYLVDVGFGRSSRYPIPFGEEMSSVDGIFRVINIDDISFEVQYKFENKWLPQYKFHTNEIKLDEFRKNCDWIQSSAESKFTQSRIITKGTEVGRITLEEDLFKARDQEDTVRIKINNKNDFDFYLEKFFF